MGKHNLQVTLPSDLEIRMERMFDAPRELVWAASTEAQHLKKWWARGHEMIVDKLDVRVGGAWRFIERTPDGMEYAFRGEFKIVDPPQTLAMTFEFEPMPGHILLQTIQFEAVGQQTRMIAIAKCDSKTDRDGMVQAGMENGARQSYEHLDTLLEELRSKR